MIEFIKSLNDISSIQDQKNELTLFKIRNGVFNGNRGIRYIRHNNISIAPPILLRMGTAPNEDCDIIDNFENIFLWTDDYGDRNICHWFHEQLPGIILLKQLFDIIPNIKIIVNKHARIKRNIKDVLLMIPNLKMENIYEFDLNNKNGIYAKNIYFSLGNFNKKLALPNKIFHFLKNDCSINIPNSEYKNIYISRRKTKTNTRVLKNMDEISEKVIKKGYTEIFMEDLSMIEKISILNNCENVIMELGAGCINLCFCKDKTKITILMQDSIYNNGFFNNMFSNITSHLKLAFIKGHTISNEHNGDPINTPWYLDSYLI